MKISYHLVQFCNINHCSVKFIKVCRSPDDKLTKHNNNYPGQQSKIQPNWFLPPSRMLPWPATQSTEMDFWTSRKVRGQGRGHAFSKAFWSVKARAFKRPLNGHWKVFGEGKAFQKAFKRTFKSILKACKTPLKVIWKRCSKAFTRPLKGLLNAFKDI